MDGGQLMHLAVIRPRLTRSRPGHEGNNPMRPLVDPRAIELGIAESVHGAKAPSLQIPLSPAGLCAAAVHVSSLGSWPRKFVTAQRHVDLIKRMC